MHIFSKLDAFEQERSARLAHPKLSQYPTPFKINVGKLNAGVWPSSVPDLAVMEIRYGMSPNETVETAKAEFEVANILLGKSSGCILTLKKPYAYFL